MTLALSSNFGESSHAAKRLLFAVPKKGRLYDQCMKLLDGADVQFHRKNRLDIAKSTNLDVDIVFLPAADIPKFVGEGTVDLGITGQDVIAESGVVVNELIELGFGKCSLCVQVPTSSDIKTPKDLIGKRIVTSFENLAEKYFSNLENGGSGDLASVLKSTTNGSTAAPLETTISYISGSVEAACALGLSDGIIDLVESGETMRACSLHAIATILTSQAVLISNPASNHSLIPVLKNRIAGFIAAQRFVYCNFNIPRDKLKDVVRITPGKKAPTVSSLEDSNWVGVGVMVEKSKIAEKMDQLENIGATDLLVFNIANCRV